MFCSIESNRSTPLANDPRSEDFVQDMKDWSRFVELCKQTGVENINERSLKPEDYWDFVISKLERQVSENKLRNPALWEKLEWETATDSM